MLKLSSPIKLASQLTKRTYTSTSTIVPIRTEILKKSLAFAKEYGFTQKSIRYGLEELNYPSVTMGIFRHPEVELLDYFLTKAKEESVIKVEEEVLKSMTQEQKLKYLCWNRLSYNKKYIKVLPEAFAHFASVNGSSMALEQLKALMNEIQYKSGDKSFNMEWYKKRIGLAMAYTSTELFMFQDLSEDFQLSEIFLKDRMKEINDVKLLAEDLTQITHFGYKSVLGLLEAKGVRF